MNASEPLMKCRKKLDGGRKQRREYSVRSSMETCLLIERPPALRWHDFLSGLCTELGNHHPDVKGEAQARSTCKSQSTNAGAWDGATRSSDAVLVMETGRRGCILQADKMTKLGIWDKFQTNRRYS